MTHKEKAMKIFYEKFNCSQAVLGAYAEEYGLTVDQAMKVAACFFKDICPRMVESAVDILEEMEI